MCSQLDSSDEHLVGLKIRSPTVTAPNHSVRMPTRRVPRLTPVLQTAVFPGDITVWSHWKDAHEQAVLADEEYSTSTQIGVVIAGSTESSTASSVLLLSQTLTVCKIRAL